MNAFSTSSTPGAPSLPLDVRCLKKATLLLRTVNHPVRLSLLRLLHRRQQLSEEALQQGLRLPPVVAAQHLNLLCRAGIVRCAAGADRILYCIDYSRLRELDRFCGLLLS